MEYKSMFRRGGDIYINVIPQKVTREMIEYGYAIDDQIKVSLHQINGLEDLDLRSNITTNST